MSYNNDSDNNSSDKKKLRRNKKIKRQANKELLQRQYKQNLSSTSSRI